MSDLIAFQCPTCGARLQIDGNQKQFSCEHCGNRYLLSQVAASLPAAERAQILPLVTFTEQLNQWVKAGEYEVRLRQTLEERSNNKRIFLIDIEYRNQTSQVLSCRSSQWVLFDSNGYTYSTFYYGKEVFEACNRPSLTSERFTNPGGKVRGWLAFEIPAEITIEKLQFLTGFISTKTIEFTLKK